MIPLQVAASDESIRGWHDPAQGSYKQDLHVSNAEMSENVLKDQILCIVSLWNLSIHDFRIYWTQSFTSISQ